MSRPSFNIPCRGNGAINPHDDTSIVYRPRVPYLYTLPYETRWAIEHYDELRHERERAEIDRRNQMIKKAESMFCVKN